MNSTEGEIQICVTLLVGFCDLVAPVVLILRTSMRKATVQQFKQLYREKKSKYYKNLKTQMSKLNNIKNDKKLFYLLCFQLEVFIPHC